MQRMPWQRNTPYALQGVLALWNGWGVNGGVENVGWKTHGFVGIQIGNFGVRKKS